MSVSWLICASLFLSARASDRSKQKHTFEREQANIKDATLIFDDVWIRLSMSYGGESKLLFPKEIIWLNGAPGAGKTTNTGFIRTERSILPEPLVVSSLLQDADMQRVKDQGGLVGDKQVTWLLFMKLLDPQYNAGVVVDGFPRTHAQAAICRMLHDRLTRLHRYHKIGDLADFFLRPVFRIVVLYVDESTSVARQLSRGKRVEGENALVAETGVGVLQEVRATDKDEALARKRYKTFMEHTYEALQSLGTLFIFHLINAGSSFAEVEANIGKELAYQSSVELNPDTFDIISQLELASEVTMNARQRLVKRMDSYAQKAAKELLQVVTELKTEVYPVIQMHAISGRCSYVSHSPLFLDEIKLQMAIDVLSERGFRVTSEPVVRGTKFDIKWVPPEKVGMTRLDPQRQSNISDGRKQCSLDGSVECIG